MGETLNYSERNMRGGTTSTRTDAKNLISNTGSTSFLRQFWFLKIRLEVQRVIYDWYAPLWSIAYRSSYSRGL